MTNFKRLIIFNEKNNISVVQEAAMWSQPKSKKVGIVIEVDNNILKISSKFGRSPYYEEVVEVFWVFLREYQKIHGEIHVFDRRCKYRFVGRNGISGCMDVYLETEKNENADGFPRRKKIMHKSMHDKINETINCFVYDFLDLVVGLGLAFIKEYDCYSVYSVGDEEEELEDENQLEIRVNKPRLTEKELGWLQPGQYGPVVNLYEEGVIQH